MCGRYALNANLEDIYKNFNAMPSQKQRPELPHHQYNIAPSANVPIIIKNIVGQAKWAYVPHWAENDEMGIKLKNARAETIANKPSFRDAWQKGKRCGIPLSGFYEWQTNGKTKTPHFVSTAQNADDVMNHRPIFFAAGLWESWQGQIGFTILTKDARPSLSAIHHREPVLFNCDQYKEWSQATPAQAINMINSDTIPDLYQWPVGKEIGNSKKNDPALIRPDQKFDKLL